MRQRPKTLLALALALAAGSAAAQTVTAPVAPEGISGTGAGASVTGGASASPMAAPSMAPGLAASPGLGSVSPSAPAPSMSAAANMPANAAGGQAGGVPALSANGAPSTSRSIPAAGVSAASAELAPNGPVSSQTSALPSGSRAPAALSGPRAAAAPSAARAGAAAPAAGAALEGTAKKLGEARLADGEFGGLSVSRALDRAFDASAGAAALRASPGAQGRFQDVRGAIAQKVSIANTASPADAPSLYQDAIQTAKDALPAPAASGVARVVRSFASRKADVSLGDLATAAFTAAAAGSKAETGRLLSAFDKWETLLGSQGRPLVTNARELKSSANELLDSAAAGAGRSAPHVWFAKKDGAFTAVLPGARVAPVPALAATFAIAPSALAPETALGDAYRAFSADPRASTGAGLVYRARRALGSSVPAALTSAARFWLRAALESLWKRIVAFFQGGDAYALSAKSGQDALRRDAGLSATARAAAASARRRLADPRLTVAGTRAAFADLARSADAYRALTGEGDAGAAVDALRRSFESAAAWNHLQASDELPPGLSELVSGPGAVDHWAQRLEDAAAESVNGRFWRARGASEFVNLGAPDGSAVSAAAAVKAAAGSPLAIVTLDDQFWARGGGAHGEARLSAELRPTSSGGDISLFVERSDAALARRLEDMGLTVFPDGAGLRAVAGPEDFARGPAELGALASRALAAALGRASEETSDASLRALASETRRDPAAAARLAALLDGREAFARAPVIGWVGEYEALAPTTVSIEGRPLLVSALRDPDTGLLAYARAARPDGAPIGAAETRALLRVK
ncbi:MAG TPA: hypothetical protein VN915_14215 [Elusimicrobiota bacterium]|nr:hypothetical protein [Elusimicrobiota bacterium]